MAEPLWRSALGWRFARAALCSGGVSLGQRYARVVSSPFHYSFATLSRLFRYPFSTLPPPFLYSFSTLSLLFHFPFATLLLPFLYLCTALLFALRSTIKGAMLPPSRGIAPLPREQPAFQAPAARHKSPRSFLYIPHFYQSFLPKVWFIRKKMLPLRPKFSFNTLIFL